jgi:hypothetical protein
MNIRAGILALLILLPFGTRANELKPETVKAWDEYVQSANAQLRDRVNHGGPFLRVEETPGLVSSLARGEIVVEPLAQNGRHSVPHGLIHDWYGAVFVPDTTIQEVLSVLNDYSRYREFFHPAVVDSKLLERTEGTERFSLLMLSKVLFVTVAVDGQYESRLTCLPEKLAEKRCYVVSYSVRTQQIKDYGGSSERALPPDEGDGYLWRLYGITMFEEHGGGVLIENESIALSRDIPLSVRWLVNPVVNHLSRNSLSTALQQTRDSVSATRLESQRAAMERLASVQLSAVRRPNLPQLFRMDPPTATTFRPNVALVTSANDR